MIDTFPACFFIRFPHSPFIYLQTEIAKRLNVICAQLIPFLSQEVRWDRHTQTRTLVPQLHIVRLAHATLRSDSVIDVILSFMPTHKRCVALFVSVTLSLSHTTFLTFSRISSRSLGCRWEAYCYSCKPTSTKLLQFAHSFSWLIKHNFPSCFKGIYINVLCVRLMYTTENAKPWMQSTKTQ